MSGRLYYLRAKGWGLRIENAAPMTAAEALDRLERARTTALMIEVRDEDGAEVSVEQLRREAGLRD